MAGVISISGAPAPCGTTELHGAGCVIWLLSVLCQGYYPPRKLWVVHAGDIERTFHHAWPTPRAARFSRGCAQGRADRARGDRQAGVSQPAVSKHLGALKQAGLVRDRHGAARRITAPQPASARAAYRLDPHAMLVFWQDRFDKLEDLAEENGPMTQTTAALTVVVERDIPHPPEKIWRALTQPLLIAEWLMQNDFVPNVGHRFNFRADYLPRRARLRGSRDRAEQKAFLYMGLHERHPAFDAKTVVTYTLTPTSTGTHLRVEQAGFRADSRRLTAAPNMDGRNSSPSWSRFWRGRSEVRRIRSRRG